MRYQQAKLRYENDKSDDNFDRWMFEQQLVKQSEKRLYDACLKSIEENYDIPFG